MIYPLGVYLHNIKILLKSANVSVYYGVGIISVSVKYLGEVSANYSRPLSHFFYARITSRHYICWSTFRINRLKQGNFNTKLVVNIC
jgi:hypothetical protein